MCIHACMHDASLHTVFSSISVTFCAQLFVSTLEVNSHFHGLHILPKYPLNTGHFGPQSEYCDREYASYPMLFQVKWKYL